MAPYQLTCDQVALLLAEKITPNINLEEQLLHVTSIGEDFPNAFTALYLIIRTQLGFQPGDEQDTFFHECWRFADDHNHRPFENALVCSMVGCINKINMCVAQASLHHPPSSCSSRHERAAQP